MVVGGGGGGGGGGGPHLTPEILWSDPTRRDLFFDSPFEHEDMLFLKPPFLPFFEFLVDPLRRF